jgi:hypothetical protein
LSALVLVADKQATVVQATVVLVAVPTQEP